MYEDFWNFIGFANMSSFSILISLIFIPIFIFLYYRIKKEEAWRDSVSKLLNYSKMEELKIYNKLTLKKFNERKRNMENKLAEKFLYATLPLSILLYILLVSASNDFLSKVFIFLYLMTLLIVLSNIGFWPILRDMFIRSSNRGPKNEIDIIEKEFFISFFILLLSLFLGIFTFAIGISLAIEVEMNNDKSITSWDIILNTVLLFILIILSVSQPYKDMFIEVVSRGIKSELKKVGKVNVFVCYNGCYIKIRGNLKDISNKNYLLLERNGKEIFIDWEKIWLIEI